MNLKKIFLHYITFNSLFIKDILIFFLDKITLYTNIRNSAEKISINYAFEKTKKIKKIYKSKILDLK